MDYQELKQLKNTLDKYKITDFKQLDNLLMEAFKEYQLKTESEIADLQSKIDAIHLIKIPKDASDEVKQIINEKNGYLIATEITPIQSIIDQKQLLLSEIQNG